MVNTVFRSLILIFIFFSLVRGEEEVLIMPNGVKRVFKKIDTQYRSVKKNNKNIYYERGHRVEINGQIILKGDNKTVKKIVKKYGLIIIKKLNQNFYLIKNTTSFNDIKLCSKINQENSNVEAIPNFKRKRKLY